MARSSGATLSVSVYQQLKTDITHWVYRPGEKMREETIAERFGVSRTPVREALHRLEQEKLVVYVSQQGYSIREINLKEFNEFYQVRIALEELGVSLAVQVRSERETKGVLEELHKVWRKAPVEIPVGGDPNFVYSDESFHERLALVGGNGYLRDSLKSLNERLRIMRINDFGSVERIEKTYGQHAGILEAIMQGDLPEARVRMREHIVESQAHVSTNALRALARLHRIELDPAND